MGGSFHGGTCKVDSLSSALEALNGTGARLHIAPSELNTPTPNSGSIIPLIAAPRNDLLEYLPV